MGWFAKLDTSGSQLEYGVMVKRLRALTLSRARRAELQRRPTVVDGKSYDNVISRILRNDALSMYASAYLLSQWLKRSLPPVFQSAELEFASYSKRVRLMTLPP